MPKVNQQAALVAIGIQNTCVQVFRGGRTPKLYFLQIRDMIHKLLRLGDRSSSFSYVNNATLLWKLGILLNAAIQRMDETVGTGSGKGMTSSPGLLRSDGVWIVVYTHSEGMI